MVSEAQAVLAGASLNLEAFLPWSAGQLGHLIYGDMAGLEARVAGFCICNGVDQGKCW